MRQYYALQKYISIKKFLDKNINEFCKRDNLYIIPEKGL
jgi:hypothetical protein